MLKALSLWQPWASAMSYGRKRIETRSWPAPRHLYGKEMAIHASQKKLTAEEIADSLMWYSDSDYLMCTGYSCDMLPKGAIVGVGTLVTCYRTEDLVTAALPGSLFLPEGCGSFTELGKSLGMRDDDAYNDAYLGNYAPGRFAWVYEGMQRLAGPVPCRGFQHVFDVPEHVERKVRAQLRR